MSPRFIFIIYSMLTMTLLTTNVASAQNATNQAGQAIYKKYCSICHSKGMAPMIKAPMTQNPDAWKKFLIAAIQEATKNKTIDCSSLTKSVSDTNELSPTDDHVQKLTSTEKACYLLPIAKTGKATNGAVMPPMGTCIDCKDSDLQSAIEFMITSKKQ